ncbi:MAG TPA: hypothetical protein VM557_01850 [Thermoanaerobaculia bacterium]|nr:hypothetical protein [Thermoanaerobaculia bacterium]
MTPNLEPSEAMRRGIEAVKDEEYLLGLNLLSDAYSGKRNAAVPPPDGLSYLGLCLALVQRKFKPAIEFCEKAIELQFYHPEHYSNLARVYVAAEKRKKAVDAVKRGLKVLPEDEGLARLRDELGQRKSPPIPFLSRNNPLNVLIGRARHAKKAAPAKKKTAAPSTKKSAKPRKRSK